jgi:arsenite methyltransferase
LAVALQIKDVSRYADMFAAMGAEPRLRIMRLLLSAHPEGLVVGEIGEELKNEELISMEREGTFLRYRANCTALGVLLGFLYAECCTRNKAVEPEQVVCCGEKFGEKIMSAPDVKEVVKEKYGEAARRVASGSTASCCGASPCGTDADAITKDLYSSSQVSGLPQEALQASLGCGNPTALAQLNPGETVLDLGSGGGIDVLLSARRVGPSGKAYGLDMTEDMLALARENQKKAGVDNVEFLKGEMENIPLPDNSVDIIISNCVINLSADKDRVLREAFRVLKPGGRFAVSDVVVRGDVPPQIKTSIELWCGCVAGALKDVEYMTKLTDVGFESIEIEPTRVYNIEDARSFLSAAGMDVDAIAPQVEGRFISAFVRAVKPAGCCAPDCCH